MTTLANAPAADPAGRLFGHRHVPLGRHWLGVLVASLTPGLLMTATTAAFMPFVLTEQFRASIVLWGLFLMLLVGAFLAAPFAAIGFTAARFILTRFRSNFGFAYVGLGLAMSVWVMSLELTPERNAALMLSQAAFYGIAAGLAYWWVAARGDALAETSEDVGETCSDAQPDLPAEA